MVDADAAPSLWDRYLAASRPDIGYKQYAWWGELQATRGWGHFEVVVGESEDAIRGGARVYVESFAPDTCYYYVPDGPVLPDAPDEAQAVFDATLDFMRAQAAADPWTVSHVRIEPRWRAPRDVTRGFLEARSWKEPRDTLVVDLTLSEDEILAQMKRKGRYNTRLAARKGVTIAEDSSPQGIADFLDIYNDTLARHDIKGHSAKYFRNFMPRAMTDDRGSILFAEYEGQRLATALILHCGDTATYKYGGQRETHRNLMAPYLLHFDAMCRAKARGQRWYDFYGIAPPDKPDHRFAGFSEFKRKFGGDEWNFVPAMDCVFDEGAYRAFKNRKKKRKDRR